MKRWIKSVLRLVCTVLVLPLAAVYFVLARLKSSDEPFAAVSQLMSLIPGLTGNYLRNAYYILVMERCEAGVVIAFGVLFSHRATEIATGAYLGPQCNIGSSRIERNVLLGSGVHILSGKGQHNFDDIDTPVQQQGGRYEKIIIGEDSWIGNGAVVMADVGRKCVVGAGSVVIHPVEDYSIVAGNPAVLIRKRK